MRVKGELGERLGNALRRLDPVPPDLLDACAAAIGERPAGAALATLEFDSLIDDRRLPGFVQGPASRALAFRTDDVALIAWMHGVGDHRVVNARIVAQVDYAIHLRMLGRPSLPAHQRSGPVSSWTLRPWSVAGFELLLPETDGAGDRVIVTDWVII